MARFLAETEFWLRDIFSAREARAERYRQAVADEAFETWMNSGHQFASAIEDRIAAAMTEGDHNAVRFWQDVFASAHQFDADPENRRKRDAMTFLDDDVPANMAHGIGTGPHFFPARQGVTVAL